MATARGQITITDLNDARTLYMYLAASDNMPAIQGYNKDSDTYTPNWDKSTGGTPFLVTPVMLVSGNPARTVLPSELKSVTWTLSKPGDSSSTPSDFSNYGVILITKTNYNSEAVTQYRDDLTAADENKLLVYANLVGNRKYLKIECEAIWTDDRTSLDIMANAMLDFSRNDSSAAMARAIIDVNGSTLTYGVFHNGSPANMVLAAKLMRGAEVDSSNVTYAWSTSDGTPITGINMIKIGGKNAYQLNATGNQLTVYPDGVDGDEVFFCNITDTDQNSPTYNETFSASEAIVDLSDPWYVDIEHSANVLKNSTGKVTARAILKRRNDNAVYSGTPTYQWTKVDANTGVRDYSWRTTFTLVGSPSGNPKAQGYYERTGTEGNYVYTPSESTTVQSGVTYCNGVTAATTTAQTIEIDANDVTYRSTFVCTVTL